MSGSESKWRAYDERLCGGGMTQYGTWILRDPLQVKMLNDETNVRMNEHEGNKKQSSYFTRRSMPKTCTIVTRACRVGILARQAPCHANLVCVHGHTCWAVPLRGAYLVAVYTHPLLSKEQDWGDKAIRHAKARSYKHPYPWPRHNTIL
ncbi:hypothetical protein HAX54_023612 [Datura stramonium]|uniref:Uncharacterized protein n=1 Tax=Datura stramonium TaxID=4076 RepID=A0ABS8UWM1_DATST|nr:hypothetical protein [Datura stramonium]